MPGANCKHTEQYPDGEKDTEDCNAGDACPLTTSSTGALVAAIVCLVLIGIAGIVAFKFRNIIGNKLGCNRRSNHPPPRVTMSLRDTEASQMSTRRQRGEPIAVSTFRQLMRNRNVPGEDEFKRLDTADVRLNRLNKSKEAGLAANRNMDSPRNR